MERRIAQEKTILEAKLNALDAETAATRSALASLTNSTATTPLSSMTSTPVVPMAAPVTEKFTSRPTISFAERGVVQSSSSLKRVITSADYEDEDEDDDVQVVMPATKKAKVTPAAMTHDATPSRDRTLKTTLFKCLCNGYFYALRSDRADYSQLASHREKCHHEYNPPDSERDDDLVSLSEVAIKKGKTFVAEVLTPAQVASLSKGVNRTYHSDPVKRS